MNHQYLVELLREAQLSVIRDMASSCVCEIGHSHCKYCQPLRALAERIDTAIETYTGDGKDIQ